ncbi:hypothetical protein Micbo1qcDRAFT_198870 [Microdochium bolleyi]|uniref:Uncharacterized protein n=1 Tax=Microdochium bolleyi TaxID=196109 RepID=A0A136IK49_9PEZI|nr:hypothetical protein Micbo1qcDRAFT_198870 [Microdochium bolleyi]
MSSAETAQHPTASVDTSQLPEHHPETTTGWQEESSGNGEKYRVKAEAYDLAEEVARGTHTIAASGPSFDNVAVDWKVGTEGVTTKEVQERTSIIFYKLAKIPFPTPWPLPQYELTIIAKDSYHFYFTDGEPDTYGLNVIQNVGSHYLQYRSSSPNIVKISGN